MEADSCCCLRILVKHKSIVDKLKPYVHVPFQFEKTGSTIALYQPNGLWRRTHEKRYGCWRHGNDRSGLYPASGKGMKVIGSSRQDALNLIY